ncbi:hypothetical protein GCM10009117_17340 [Gangjinia marincola]|uniref:DUF4301 domain-containing protein n=1 Tax=Gangjinia marincola TaxID=578463 RepID=A0ABP3XW24_9FLAO
MKLEQKDITAIKEHGLSLLTAEKQLATFERGIAPIKIKEAATIGHGILKLGEDEQKDLVRLYEKKSSQYTIVKFVPASGAASRMFKSLFSFLDQYDPSKESVNEFVERTNNKDIKTFFDGLKKFPFYEEVVAIMSGKGEVDLGQNEHKVIFVKTLLTSSGLNYGHHPKGVLAFHKYDNRTVTPFEEHLFEGASYASTYGKSHLHFTISPQHKELFESIFTKTEDYVSKATQTNFKVDYSAQKNATDTIAVNMQNEPYRQSNGKLLLRPGGHGALIENLNDIEADLIFIKNIDNVVTTEHEEEVVHYKKVLGGKLLELQTAAYGFMNELNNKEVKTEVINETHTFLTHQLKVVLPEGFLRLSKTDQIDQLQNYLNRPIRICGMVKNEGEPGGGPFWVEHQNGSVSLQIVESAQVDLTDDSQKEILTTSTHFNPVDIVCGVKGFKGDKLNLLDFVDPEAGFITEKTVEGNPIKALELPGLWNGAMAKWNTVFVEVPLNTFNPVKTVNDLLKPTHQAKGGR